MNNESTIKALKQQVKELEGNLRESEDRYKHFIDNTPAAIYEIDFLTGKFVSVNDFMCKTLGYTEEELLAISPLDIICEEHKSLFLERVENVKAGRSISQNLEYKVCTKNGMERWAFLDVRVKNDKSGKPESANVIATDITARKRKEALILSERDLGFKLSTAASLKEALTICLESAIRISEMDSGGIYLVNPKDGSVDLVSHMGFSEGFLEGTKHYASDTPNAAIINKGAPVYAEYQETVPDLDEKRLGEGLKAVAILPVSYRDKIIACLNIASHTLDTVPAYTRSTLERITSHIGDAIIREKHEDALRESEERLNQAQKLAHLGSWELDFDTGKLSVSNELLRIHQIDPIKKETVDLDYFVEFIHPDDKERVSATILQSIYKKEPFDIDFRIIRKDGDIRYLHSQGDVILDNSGRIVKMITSGHDNTEQKQAEIALRTSDTILRNMFQAIPDLLTVIDRDYTVVYSNWKGRDYVPVAKRSSHPYCYSVYLDRDEPCEPCHAAEVFESGYPKSFEHSNPANGVTREINLYPILNERGDVDMVTEYIRDITVRKKAEKALKRQNDYMVALHETSLGIIGRQELSDLLQSIVERASEIAQVPNGFLHIYNSEKNSLELKAGSGYYSEYLGFEIHPGEGLTWHVWEKGEKILVDDYYSWSGRHPSPLFDHIRAIVGIPVKSGSKIEGVIGMGHHDEGKTIDMETVSILEQFGELAAIAIDNSRLYGAMKNEIEKSKKLEKERTNMESRLRQAQKMEAIGTLAGGIAHDFNNILYPIMGYAELAIDELDEDSVTRNYIHHILNATVRAKDLVQQILAFSRNKDKEHKPFKIDQVAFEALKLLRSSIPKNIEIVDDIDSDLGVMMGDPSEIHQIIMNLCTNAYHAMEETGGKLNVILKEVDLDEKEVWQAFDISPGKYIRLTVQDNGSGMTSEVMERIFDPYFSTKVDGKGTGLGLSVTHGIVKNHNGAITVHSEPFKGTVLHVYFPMVEIDHSPVESNIRETDLEGNERILIVDDEAQIVDMAKQVLSRLGYQVTIRTSSIEALETFQANPHAFDLVLTDMTMPNMTGDILSQKIMEIRPDIPIVLCTGFSERISEEKAASKGIKALLMKPLVKNEMAMTIRDVFKDMDKT